MADSEVVAVIGGGSWGTTLAKIASDNGRKTLLWARREDLCREINETRENRVYLPGVTLPPNLEATHDLGRVCAATHLLILVVPSHGLRAVAREIGSHVTGQHVLVHGTKGIEVDTFKRMTEIIREETCLRKIGVLTGPNLARELAQREPAGTLVASHYDEVFERAQAALQSDYFRVYYSHDVVGAEVGGAFKNIVALAAGMVSGLGFGENTKSLLLTRALSEMARLGVAMGADVLTFGGMAGIGDLMATAASRLSRNHQVGTRLAQGETLEQIQTEMKMVAEGVKTTRAIHDFALRRELDLPIVAAVYHLLYEGGNAPELMRDLMTAPTGREFVALAP